MSAGRRVRAWIGLGCAALLSVSCGFPTEDSPSAIAGDTRPDATGPGGSGAVTATDEVTAWFIQDDLLVPLPREVPAPVAPAAVVAVLGQGVSPAETERGLRSSIPDAAMLLGAEVGGGTATVELAPEFLEIAPGDQVLALGQVVMTLTDLRGIGRVRFVIDGLAVSTPLPDGTSTEDSVSREDFRVLAGSG